LIIMIAALANMIANVIMTSNTLSKVFMMVKKKKAPTPQRRAERWERRSITATN